ncbi:MAG: hypothetical protein DRN07_01675 [Thermoplasmata archaeon]|nr:MAG: hypothetical protein DRN07_01675 [Thermoplasmata archaeon]
MEIGDMKVDAKFVLSILSLIIGIVFYLLWGLTYGVWADVGIYSVTAVFVILGLIGLLLIRTKE